MEAMWIIWSKTTPIYIILLVSTFYCGFGQRMNRYDFLVEKVVFRYST